MEQERTVLCMKWGTIFPPSYVNVLYNACSKAITGDFRFACLTDDSTGLHDKIEAFPIPEHNFPPHHWTSGAWPKLSVFSKDLYGLEGRALFIDLDTVVTGSLDPFFEEKGDLIAVGAGKNWRRNRRNNNPTANTSIFAFTLGDQCQIMEVYRNDPDAAFDMFKIEQKFVENYATSWRPWPEGWVISYKRHLRRSAIIDRFREPRKPTASTKIVAFHGDPRPISMISKGSYNYERFPYYGKGPTDWVREYWLKNGWDENLYN